MRARAATAGAQTVGAPQTAPVPVASPAAPGPAALASVRVAPWGDDPFWKTSGLAAPRGAARHAVPWKPTGAGLRLKGILWSGTEAGSSAQVCDEVARVGDTVYRWKVIHITPNSVTLEDRGAVITLKLNEDRP
jgi:hypothetical protein